MPAAAGAQQRTEAVDTGDEPIFFTSDELMFERDERLVIARGNVEVIRGERVLLADELEFDRDTNLFVARGNVSLSQPDRSVIFAEELEITGDLNDGFADQLRVLLGDDSRLAAASGTRVNGEQTVLNQAVYSPCMLCEAEPDKPPLWQLRARRVVHDEAAKDVIYRDATIEFFGVPVLYTPYFAHPDPTVFQRTGLLSTFGGASSELGTFATSEYYIGIDESTDATLNATLTTERGFRLGGEFRKRFTFGDLMLDGSFSGADRTRGLGDQTEEVDETFRGHLFGTGRFDVRDNWRAGFDLQRVTDDTFLREFDITSDDILETRAFAEYFDGRDYGVVNVYAFQDLRPTVIDDEPIALPFTEWSWIGRPGETLGGRWDADLGLRNLSRSDGPDSTRLSAKV